MSLSSCSMPRVIVGDISPSQVATWGIFREFHQSAIMGDNSPMTEINIKAIRETIEREMSAKGFSRRSLSSAAGLSESAVRDLMTRIDNPGISTLHKIAEALEVPFDALTGKAEMVPILGNIGAGGQVMFLRDYDSTDNSDDCESVPRPPLAPGRLMALKVVGNSMMPKYEEGEIIYVARDHDGILPHYIGRYCAVRTADGGTFLKILARGSTEGRYTLRSLNAPDMEDVEIQWASPVLFVMPR